MKYLKFILTLLCFCVVVLCRTTRPKEFNYIPKYINKPSCEAAKVLSRTVGSLMTTRLSLHSLQTLVKPANILSWCSKWELWNKITCGTEGRKLLWHELFWADAMWTDADTRNRVNEGQSDYCKQECLYSLITSAFARDESNLYFRLYFTLFGKITTFMLTIVLLLY